MVRPVNCLSLSEFYERNIPLVDYSHCHLYVKEIFKESVFISSIKSGSDSPKYMEFQHRPI